MRFVLERTSLWNNDKPLDDERVCWDEYVQVDERNVDDIRKIPFLESESPAIVQIMVDAWYGNGYNHRVVNGHICRNVVNFGWVIEIASLEELIQLMKDVDEEIIVNNCCGVLTLEIYDGFRE